MVLTVSFVISSVNRAFLPPSPAGIACKLDTSVGVSGPHDFAVRHPHRSPGDKIAATASRSHVRDDAYAPLAGAGRRELVEMICPTSKAKYFFDRVWTTQITLKPLTKLVFARTCFRELITPHSSSCLRVFRHARA
jgi:hypothetical protein